jgi:hypothetical protein
MGLGEAWRR